MYLLFLINKTLIVGVSWMSKSHLSILKSWSPWKSGTDLLMTASTTGHRRRGEKQGGPGNQDQGEDPGEGGGPGDL